jgi:hypothetical protein
MENESPQFQTITRDVERRMKGRPEDGLAHVEVVGLRLLLLATTINYWIGKTLANAAVRITKSSELSKETYSWLELAFGWAFRRGFAPVRLYCRPSEHAVALSTVLFAWSLNGLSLSPHDKLQRNFSFVARCLAFLKHGHWPCALKTTHLLLSPQDRTMGNSVSAERRLYRGA